MDFDTIIFLILAVIVLFCFTVFAALSYSGLFYEPPVTTGEPPWRKSAVLAYKFLRGPYNGNHVGATFTEATCLAPNAPPIGVFYDDPCKKMAHRLRCIVGCVVKECVGENDETMHVTDEELEMLKEKKFIVHPLPSVDLAVLADFPYTTPLSVWLAPNRVYSRLSRYIEERRLCAYPMIEVYKGGKILYAAPLSKQEGFFVPECPLADKEDAEEDERLKNEDNGDVTSSDVEDKDDEDENLAATTSEDGALVAKWSSEISGGIIDVPIESSNSGAKLVKKSASPREGVAVPPSGDDDDSSFEDIGSTVDDLLETAPSNKGIGKKKSASSKKFD